MTYRKPVPDPRLLVTGQALRACPVRKPPRSEKIDAPRPKSPVISSREGHVPAVSRRLILKPLRKSHRPVRSAHHVSEPVQCDRHDVAHRQLELRRDRLDRFPVSPIHLQFQELRPSSHLLFPLQLQHSIIHVSSN